MTIQDTDIKEHLITFKIPHTKIFIQQTFTVTRNESKQYYVFINFCHKYINYRQANAKSSLMCFNHHHYSGRCYNQVVEKETIRNWKSKIAEYFNPKKCTDHSFRHLYDEQRCECVWIKKAWKMEVLN